MWDSGITAMLFSFYQVRVGSITLPDTACANETCSLPVVLTGAVNVLLFCATHRVLPAKSVAPGWRGLFRLSGFTESNPSKDLENSFACRGTGRDVGGKDLEKGHLAEEDEGSVCPRLQLDPLDDPRGPQVRIKIDNHIDNALQSEADRDSTSNTERSTSLSSLPGPPRRPLPALVRDSMASEISELTIVGKEWPKEVR